MTDYFGNEIKPGDYIVRIKNGWITPCICTRVTSRVYFTYDKRTWDNTTRKYKLEMTEISSKQQMINCTALQVDANVPQKHIDYYNLKYKKDGN